MGNTTARWIALFAEMDAMDAQKRARHAEDLMAEWQSEAQRQESKFQYANNQVRLANEQISKATGQINDLKAKLSRATTELAGTETVLAVTENKLAQATQTIETLSESQRALSRMVIFMTLEQRISDHEAGLSPDTRLFTAYKDPEASVHARETALQLRNDIGRALFHIGDTTDGRNYQPFTDRLFNAYKVALSTREKVHSGQETELSEGAAQFSLLRSSGRADRIYDILEFPEFAGLHDTAKIASSRMVKEKLNGLSLFIPHDRKRVPVDTLLEVYRPLLDVQRYFFGFVQVYTADESASGDKYGSPGSLRNIFRVVDHHGERQVPEEYFETLYEEYKRAPTVSQALKQRNEVNAIPEAPAGA